VQAVACAANNILFTQKHRADPVLSSAIERGLIVQGDHDQAIDRLVQNCKGDELLVQLKKMLKFRHERCGKLEDNANDLKRELQAFKSAGQNPPSLHNGQPIPLEQAVRYIWC